MRTAVYIYSTSWLKSRPRVTSFHYAFPNNCYYIEHILAMSIATVKSIVALLVTIAAVGDARTNRPKAPPAFAVPASNAVDSVDPYVRLVFLPVHITHRLCAQPYWQWWNCTSQYRRYDPYNGPSVRHDPLGRPDTQGLGVREPVQLHRSCNLRLPRHSQAGNMDGQ